MTITVSCSYLYETNSKRLYYCQRKNLSKEFWIRHHGSYLKRAIDYNNGVIILIDCGGSIKTCLRVLMQRAIKFNFYKKNTYPTDAPSQTIRLFMADV